MKIEKFSPFFNASKTNHKKNEKKSILSFKEILEHPDLETFFYTLESDLSEEDIRELGNMIDLLGEQLSHNPDIEHFNKYRSCVKALLRYALKNTEVKTITSRVGFSKVNTYLLVQSIDEKLQQMAHLILSNEKNRLSYFQLIQQIKGLLIDLVS
ncbi:MAG: YaaR family protein [Brevinematales bacterium]|nr:YaaR family protein [Brevinematales bacterium]